MGMKERNNKRLWGMFYRGPTAGVKCAYENMEIGHVRVDVAKVGFWTSHVDWRKTFVRRTRRGTCKTNDFDTQVSI